MPRGTLPMRDSTLNITTIALARQQLPDLPADPLLKADGLSPGNVGKTLHDQVVRP